MAGLEPAHAVVAAAAPEGAVQVPRSGPGLLDLPGGLLAKILLHLETLEEWVNIMFCCRALHACPGTLGWLAPD